MRLVLDLTPRRPCRKRSALCQASLTHRRPCRKRSALCQASLTHRRPCRKRSALRGGLPDRARYLTAVSCRRAAVRVRLSDQQRACGRSHLVAARVPRAAPLIRSRRRRRGANNTRAASDRPCTTARGCRRRTQRTAGGFEPRKLEAVRRVEARGQHLEVISGLAPVPSQRQFRQTTSSSRCRPQRARGAAS